MLELYAGFLPGTGTRTSTAWSCSRQLVVCLALLTALEMCHRDSGIDHDGTMVFLTDPSSRGKQLCVFYILTQNNFAIDTQISLPVVLSATLCYLQCMHAKAIMPT